MRLRIRTVLSVRTKKTSIFALILLWHLARLLVSVFLAGRPEFEQKMLVSKTFYLETNIHTRFSQQCHRYQVHNYICAYEKSKQKLITFICKHGNRVRRSTYVLICPRKQCTKNRLGVRLMSYHKNQLYN